MFPILFSLGVLYLFALGAGRFSALIRIPRVTGYLVVGLVAGPSMADLLGLPALITPDQLHELTPLHDVVLGLIVLTIGGSFRFKSVRKFGPRIFRISAVEIGITAAAVGGGTLLLCDGWLKAIFLAIMAITTAPAATQMVMREYESEGPLTDTILPLIGINNLVAIVAFILVKNHWISIDVSPAGTALQIFGPLGLGTLIGLVVAVREQRMTRQVERQILVLAAVATIVGIADFLDISAMFSALVAGVVVVNASPNDRRIFDDLAAIDYPLYVIFFIMAGAELHIESLSHMGTVGVGYVAFRILGKYFGCRLGAMSAGTSSTVRQWLGPGMLAQAGLAIGLANTLAREWHGHGKSIQTVILASVVVFEIIGPLLTRKSLVSAGEVTVLKLLVQRSPVGYAEGFHQVINHFKDSLGIDPGMRIERPTDIPVAHIMRRNVEVLKSHVSFDEVLRTLGHSRYDRLPVVNDNDELIGVIQYQDISQVLFDPALRNLVVAGDIATEDHFLLTPEDTLEKAMRLLENHRDHSYLLVVEKDNPKSLVGVVRHNDVLSTQRRQG
jgi:Kef-type K+ transport system membrane component KefB/predicted transcriptional regulator